MKPTTETKTTGVALAQVAAEQEKASTPTLTSVVEEHALPCPIDAENEDIESYILSEDKVPSSLRSEADSTFGGTNNGVYVIDAAMLRDGDYGFTANP